MTQSYLTQWVVYLSLTREHVKYSIINSDDLRYTSSITGLLPDITDKREIRLSITPTVW